MKHDILEAFYAELPPQSLTVNILEEIRGKDEVTTTEPTPLEQLLTYLETIQESDKIIEAFLDAIQESPSVIERIKEIDYEALKEGEELTEEEIVIKVLDEILEPIAEDRVLTVNLNTPGGSMDEGFAIIGVIKQLKELGVHVKTVALGSCMSMGVPIFAMGDERVSNQYAIFMFHASKGSNGVATERAHEQYLKLLQIGKSYIIDIFKDMPIAEKIVDYWTDEAHYFTAEELFYEGVVQDLF